MKRTATLLTLALLAAGVARAQPARTNNGALTDQIVARDIGDATITLDGTLDEAEWANAQTLDLTYGEMVPFIPGGGYETLGGPFTADSPTDPGTSTLRLLRKGNVLYIGLEVADKSIGGTRSFFQHDGLAMSMIDKRRRDRAFAIADTSFVSGRSASINNFELFYSWLNSGVGRIEAGQDTVGAAPTVAGGGNLDRGSDDERVDSDVILGTSYTIDGVANDDFNGNATQTDDVGYTYEIAINVETLGFDLNDASDPFPITFGVYDLDYAWPGDADLRYRTRQWFQNPWGGSFPWGVAYVVGREGVTVSSGPVPEITEPDLRIPEATVTLDGRLDEDVWGDDAPVVLQYMMTEAMLDDLPGVGPYYTGWFRPRRDGGGPRHRPLDGPLPVRPRRQHALRRARLRRRRHQRQRELGGPLRRVPAHDPRPHAGERARRGAAVPGPRVHGRRRLVGDRTAPPGRGGQPRCPGYGLPQGGLDGGDPGQRRRGLLHRDEHRPRGGRRRHVGRADLDRGQLLRRRRPRPGFEQLRHVHVVAHRAGVAASPGPAARAFLEGDFGTPTEGGPDADGFRLLGNAPNPFRATTAVRYELPRAATVTVEVFDVLGRLVRQVDAGLQAAGPNEATVEAAGLSAGAYVYRVRMGDGTAVSGRMLVVR